VAQFFGVAWLNFLALRPGSPAPSVPHHISQVKLALFSCSRLLGCQQGYSERHEALDAVSFNFLSDYLKAEHGWQ
jgi:hypothetical protein